MKCLAKRLTSTNSALTFLHVHVCLSTLLDQDNESSLKVSATLKITIFPYLRFQRFQIDMLESFLLKKNQKKILFLSKDSGGKRFFLVNYLN